MHHCVGRHAGQIVHRGRLRALDRYQVGRTVVEGACRAEGAVQAQSFIASRYVQRTARVRTYLSGMAIHVDCRCRERVEIHRASTLLRVWIVRWTLAPNPEAKRRDECASVEERAGPAEESIRAGV